MFNFIHKKYTRTMVVMMMLLFGIMLGSISSAQSVSAKNFSSMTPEEKVKSYSYYQTLGQCVYGNMKRTISGSPTQEGNIGPNNASDIWFDDWDAWGILFSDGKRDCEDMVQPAMDLWGFTNYREFIESMGFSYDQNSGDMKGPERQERRNGFQSYIKSKVYSGNEPSIGKAGDYLLYLGSLNDEKCELSTPRLYSSANSTEKSWADNGNIEDGKKWRSITYVGQNKKAEKHIISYTSSESAFVTAYGYRGGGPGSGGMMQTCDWYANRISDNALSYAMYIEQSGDQPQGVGNDNEVGGGDSEVSSCQIDGIGWIVCPISIFLAKTTDVVYKGVEGLLEVKVFSNVSSNESLRKGWNTMLGIANISFVIAFIIIIYSQLTGGGFTNYSIKRMLPRLVVAAILVNVSFWVCAIAVDMSNILGSSLQDIFTTLSKSTGKNTSIPDWQTTTTSILSAGAIGLSVIGATTITAATVYSFLAILWPLLVAAIFAVLIALILLTVRQGLIVILIVLSPLAFVAFLLPNTEKWFTRWKDLFVTMLMLFPIISIIFGGSQYAARLIMSTSPSAAVVIMALALQVVPLAVTPLLLKFSGTLLSRIGGVINNPAKGPFDRLKNVGSKHLEGRRDMYGNRNRVRNLDRAKDVINSSSNERLLGKSGSRRRRAYAAIKSRGATASINQGQKESVAKAVAEEAGQTYFAEQVMKDAAADGRFIKSITGDSKSAVGNERNSVALQASAQSAVNKIENQDKESRAILFRAKFDPREIDRFAEEFEHAIASGDTASMRASANILMNSGSKGLDKLQDSIVKMEAAHPDRMGDMTAGSDASLLRQDINAAGLKGKNNALAMFAYTNKTLSDLQNSDSTYNELTPKEITGQSADNLRAAAQNMSKEFAQSMLDNKDVTKDLSSSKQKILQDVADGNPVPMPIRKGQQPPVQSSTQQPPSAQPTNTPPTVPQGTTSPAAPSAAAAPANIQTPPTQQTNTNPTVLTIPHSNASNGKHVAAPATTVTTPLTTPINTATPSPSVSTPTPNTSSFTTQNVTVNNTTNQTVNNSGITSVPLSGRRSTAGQYTSSKDSIPKSREPGADFLPPKTQNIDPANIPREFFE